MTNKKTIMKTNTKTKTLENTLKERPMRLLASETFDQSAEET